MTDRNNEPWQWCLERFGEIDKQLGRRNEVMEERLHLIERKIDDLQGSLTGTTLHPNGMVADLKTLKEEMARLDREWRAFLDRAKGFAIGIAVGAGVTGGGVAIAVDRIISGA